MSSGGQYIDVPIVVDESQLYAVGLAAIQAIIPGWTPPAGSFTEAILKIGASFAAQAAMTASDVPFDIFLAFGKIANKLPYAAQAATVDSVWTAQDNLGYTIPALTPVGISSGDQITPTGFQTLVDTVIPPGSTTTDVLLVAIFEGEAGNDLDTVERIDSLGYITGITIDGPTSGGVDAELSADYVNRLSQELSIWTNTPIVFPNFAVAANQVPGVYRTAEWDNYNPADETTDNEKMVALCPIDVNGNALSSGLMTTVASTIEALREWNFICNVVAPSYSTIDIAYTAHTSPLNDIPTVEAEVASALGSFLNAAVWGMPAPVNIILPLWTNTPKIRLNKIIQTIENCADIDWAEPVTMCIHGGALAASDITMPGSFPLPVLGTITPTIVTT